MAIYCANMFMLYVHSFRELWESFSSFFCQLTWKLQNSIWLDDRFSSWESCTHTQLEKSYLSYLFLFPYLRSYTICLCLQRSPEPSDVKLRMCSWGGFSRTISSSLKRWAWVPVFYAWQEGLTSNYLTSLKTCIGLYCQIMKLISKWKLWCTSKSSYRNYRNYFDLAWIVCLDILFSTGWTFWIGLNPD